MKNDEKQENGEIWKQKQRTQNRKYENTSLTEPYTKYTVLYTPNRPIMHPPIISPLSINLI